MVNSKREKTFICVIILLIVTFIITASVLNSLDNKYSSLIWEVHTESDRLYKLLYPPKGGLDLSGLEKIEKMLEEEKRKRAQNQ